LRSGKTPYNQLTANLKIEQGTINVDDVRIEGPSLRVGLAGSASIPARELDLTGTASLLASSATGDAAPSFDLPFVVRGPWDDPELLPDIQKLMQRSESASRLLDFVKNHADPAPSAGDGCQGMRLATVDDCSPKPNIDKPKR
jgi:AsmA protein